jgi:hypothetical protein|tara:strand:- start:6673 stop:7167 length:495 start_codon:yes stop_codon:yes gene_type:complete
MSDNKQVSHILSGVAYWASVINPNTKFDPKWQIDVCLSDKDAEYAEKKIGLIVKTGKDDNDERGKFVTIKRNCVSGKGNDIPPPVIVDSQNQPWDGSLIGNGSKVNVKFKTYDWNYAGKSGIGTDLQKVQVVDLVEYDDGDDFEAVDGGYTVPQKDMLDDEIPF